MRKVEVAPGIELAVDVAGDGPAVVLLHERFCTHGVFAPFRRALGEGLTIVAPDLRGYGASRPPARDFPLDYHGRDAEDVAALIRALGVGPAHVVGWGDGGVVAVRTAALAPDQVATVTGIAALPAITEQTAPLWDMAVEDATIDSVVTDFFLQVEGNLDAAGRPFREAWLECVNAGLDTAYEGRGDFFLQDLAAVRCPLLFIDGSKDPFIDESLRAMVAEAAPAARRELVPGGPHELPISHAILLAGMVRGFWAEAGR